MKYIVYEKPRLCDYLSFFGSDEKLNEKRICNRIESMYDEQVNEVIQIIDKCLFDLDLFCHIKVDEEKYYEIFIFDYCQFVIKLRNLKKKGIEYDRNMKKVCNE